MMRYAVFPSVKQILLNGKQRVSEGYLTVVRGRDYSAVNVEKLASSLERTISSQDFHMSEKSCIFTTPSVLSRHNKAAYKPTAFSIGPLHHAKPDLKRTEIIKFEYLTGLVSRTHVDLRDLIGTVAELEGEARAHYGEQIDFSVDELVKILVLDGCFLIELFRKNGSVVPREPNDPIFTMSCMFQYLLHNLILLENQVPWIVLESVFDKTKGHQEASSLKDLALCFLEEELPTDRSKHFHGLGHKIESVKSRHLLELLRDVLVSTSPKEIADGNEGWPPIPFAMKLHNAGISFKKSESGGLAISFKKGVLEISPITIKETTETLFRNIISFEQCSHNCPPIFTSYALLLDNLINTTEDIEYLSKKGIVENWLNPDDATQYFNKLYHDAFIKAFYYPKFCADVNGYCQRQWPRYRALLVRSYFCNPWAIASTLAATLLLILTSLATIFTIKDYYRSIKDDESYKDHSSRRKV